MSLRIAQEFHVERTAQEAKWGDANDDKWSPGEWAALISHYATRQTVGDLHAVDAAKFRADMVKVGALAIAAIQAAERKAP
jgi:hypothetical protein